MLLSRLQALVFLAAVLSSSAVAQQFYSFQNSVAGKIFHSDMKPAVDCEVTLNPLNGGPLGLHMVRTSGGGEFEFDSVQPGIYELVARSTTGEVRQTITIDNRALPDLQLRLSEPSATKPGEGSTVSVGQLRIPERAREAFEKAERAFSKRETDSAREYLAKSLTSQPCFADALTLRALMHVQATDLPAALADLQTATQCDGSYPRAYLVLGSVYNQLHRFSDALRVLSRGIELAPTAWQGYFETAKALLGQRDFLAALQQLAKAQEFIKTSFPELHLAKAQALLGAKQTADAVGELQMYLKQTPTGPQAEAVRRLQQRLQAQPVPGGEVSVESREPR